MAQEKKSVKKVAPAKTAKPVEKTAHSVSADLPKALFGAKVNDALLAQAVRVHLANQREGSAKTKTRGEVEGSSRKIYRQKGTGRARHGSIRASIFVGGGRVFGPVPRDHSLKLTKNMKREAIISALSAKAKDTIVLPGLEAVEPKTKHVVTALRSAHVSGSTLLVVSKDASNLMRAARNIGNVTLIKSTDLNPYAVLTHKTIVFTKESIQESEKHFART